jgi:hypothetical protein
MRSILDPLLGPLHFLEFSVCSFQSMLIIRLIISLLARGPAEERLIGEKDILHPDAERRLIHMQITLDIDDTIAALLATLDDDGSAQNAINELVSHAMQGVYRPGSWERP